MPSLRSQLVELCLHPLVWPLRLHRSLPRIDALEVVVVWMMALAGLFLLLGAAQVLAVLELLVVFERIPCRAVSVDTAGQYSPRMRVG